MAEVLYPSEDPQVKRLSSINQFEGFLSKWVQGGPAPIVFDKLDGITCDTVVTHPVVLDLSGNSLGYIFPEAHCEYSSDKYIYVDQDGVEQRILPSIFGGNGELYDAYVKKNAFVNFDNGESLGVHNNIRLRTGLEVVLANETLPFVD